MKLWETFSPKVLLKHLKGGDWQEKIFRLLEIRPALRSIPYWVAAVVVGTVAVLYSGTFSAIVELAEYLSSTRPILFCLLAPASFILSVYLVEKFAPSAGGTGTSAVAAILQLDPDTAKTQIHEQLNLKVASVVIISSFLAILGGGTLGREGPVVHIPACVFFYVGQQFSVLWPNREHRSWIIAGGAAGIAAAFNTPLAGIVFVLEELAGIHFHQFKTVVISAVIVAGMVAQYLSGKFLYLGFPKITSVEPSAMFPTLAVGVACGVGSGLFYLILNGIKESSVKFRSERKYLFVSLVGVVMALMAILVDRRTIGGGIDIVQDLLFSGESAGSHGLLLVSRFFGTILSHLTGCAGGFLAPSLSMGGMTGAIVSDFFSPKNHNLLVLVGMSGFLSAMIGAPFTALVIVMEMTDRHSVIFPLMLSALVSIGVSKAVRSVGKSSPV